MLRTRAVISQLMEMGPRFFLWSEVLANGYPSHWSQIPSMGEEGYLTPGQGYLLPWGLSGLDSSTLALPQLTKPRWMCCTGGMYSRRRTILVKKRMKLLHINKKENIHKYAEIVLLWIQLNAVPFHCPDSWQNLLKVPVYREKGTRTKKGGESL